MTTKKDPYGRTPRGEGHYLNGPEADNGLKARAVFSTLTDDELDWIWLSKHRIAMEIRRLVFVCWNWPWPIAPWIMVVGVIEEMRTMTMLEARREAAYAADSTKEETDADTKP